VGDSDIEQLVERAAKEDSLLSRHRLFHAIRSVEVFFPYNVEQRDGKEVRSTPLARLADGTHAMMLFTSKSHPALSEHRRFAGGAFKDALAAALEMPPLDWVVLWNSASQRVAIAKGQIPEILSDIDSVPEGHNGYTADAEKDTERNRAKETLEDFITSAVRSESEELPAPIGSVIGDRELFLELSKKQSEDGQPVMKTFRIEHLGHVIRAYTSRVRPGIRYGGIRWQALKEMIRTLPEIGGVQIMNDADDWVVFDREALGLNASNK
jgi:hypothetical protein